MGQLIETVGARESWMTRLVRGVAQWSTGSAPTALSMPDSDPPSLSDLLTDYPGLQLLVGLWSRAKPPSGLPRMSGIDPVDLGRGGMLPFVWVIRGAGVDDYHLSLVGSEIRANFAFNPVGKPLHTVLVGDPGRTMFERVCQVLTEELAHYSTGPVIGSAGRRYLGTRVMLPLIDDTSNHGATALIGGFQKSEDETGSVDESAREVLSPTYALNREAFFDLRR